uniref:Zinc finger protein 292 n=1 Tax=Latimeria chalumnae TaxID=7897 RepID=H3A0B3_LATCH
MADEEAEQDSNGGGAASEIATVRERLRQLETRLRESGEPPVQCASEYCQHFCQTLVEYAGKWKISEDPLPLLEVYTVAIQSYSQARPYLSSECENVGFVLERLALSCAELLLCLQNDLSDKQWEEFQTSVQTAHKTLEENGNSELNLLATISKESGVWKNPVLLSILSQQPVDQDKVNEFLTSEGSALLEMRIKHLMKEGKLEQATALAKLCSDHPEISAKGGFKQTYLVCLCSAAPNEKLLKEISEVDCKDALEMICNLESDGDEKIALILCSAFLSRQLQQGDMYCAWELTLFWSKLQQRADPSVQVYLERCRQLSLLAKTVYHIFFLIKVIQSETEGVGLPTCIELCVRALRMESCENATVKASVCKTISCLLPDDLEVKRACQLTEFLLEPTVDAYYAVEMLFNQPDQKYDEENLPVPNSLRCELLLVLKTQWPFDPEFWDWKTLKRHCLQLMGEEASIVSSIDELNDSEVFENLDEHQEDGKEFCFSGPPEGLDEATNLNDDWDEKQKKREIKKLREKGFISARFRNWQAYMQYCVLCDKEFLGHRIVRHAQKHFKNGIYNCPICAESFDTKELFVPHVTLHVKQSSKERLAAMKPIKRIGRPPKVVSIINQKANTSAKPKQRPIKKNSLYSEDFIVFNDNDGTDDDDDIPGKDKSCEADLIPMQKDKLIEEFSCPVTNCRKHFKYFKNLIAHVKGHKDNEEAKRFLEMQSRKVVCQYCRRHFVHVTHLNDHLQMHCGSKPYICIQLKCQASFNSYSELLVHRKEHTKFRAKCMFPNCGRIFSEAYLLYDHEAQHYNTYTCRFQDCGKVYHSQRELDKHQEGHVKHPEVVPAKTETSQDPNEEGDSQEVLIKLEEIIIPAFNKNSSSDNPNQDSAADIGPSQAEMMPSVGQPLVKDALGVDLPIESSGEHLVEETAPSAGQPVVDGVLGVGLPVEPSVEQPVVGATASFCMPTIDPPQYSIKLICADNENVCDNGKQENMCSKQNLMLNSEVNKAVELALPNAEEQLSKLLPMSSNNQTVHENSFLFPKLEGNINATPNLYALPLKMLEGITLVPPQSNLNNPVVIAGGSETTPVQKFSCKLEGCTRSYSSSRSVSKHMKAAHPDQYAALKLTRKNKKSLANTGLSIQNDGKFVFLLPSQAGSANNPGFSSQVSTSNSYFSAQLQGTDSLFPAHSDSLLNPALLSQMEGVMNPVLPSPVKNDTDTVLASQVNNLANTGLPSLLGDLTNPALPLKIDCVTDPLFSLPVETSTVPIFPLPLVNGANPVFPSQLENAVATSFPSQNTGDSNPGMSFKEENEPGFSSQGNNTDPPQDILNLGESNSQPAADKPKGKRNPRNSKDKKPKQNRRAKWPAIIKDGKFICSRCFRVFTNPRSLGGHLSKRSYCKPLEGTEITPEILPNVQASLLASMILSSSALSMQPPHQSTFSPDMSLKGQSFLQSLAMENEPGNFLQSFYPQANISSLNSSINEEGSEIIKQALETAGIPSAFENIKIPQQTIQTSCNIGGIQIDPSISSIPDPSQIIQATSTPSTSETEGEITLNMQMPSMLEKMRELNSFSSNELLKTLEKGFFTGALPDSGLLSQNLDTSSTAVSVISTLKNIGSSQLNQTINDSLSVTKKEKVDSSVVANNPSEGLMANNLLTALAALAKSLEVSAQIPETNLLANYSNQMFMANPPQILKTNFDAPVSVSDTKLNYQTGHDTHASVAYPSQIQQQENSDCQILEANLPCDIKQENADLEILGFNMPQNMEKNVDLQMAGSSTSMQMLNSGFTKKSEINTAGVLPKAEKDYGPQILQPPTLRTTESNFNVKVPELNEANLMSSTNFNSSPSDNSQKVDDQISDILGALQNLNLENDDQFFTKTQVIQLPNTGEVSAVPEGLTQFNNVNVVLNQNLPLPKQQLKTVNKTQSPEKISKPFVCQDKGCNYSAMTKDALFKHYARVHQYTSEMIMEIKKHQLKYAPFRCVVPNCAKTFTRNSNLRAHCQSVHQFTQEEMVKLKIKRPYSRKPVNENLSAVAQPVYQIEISEKEIKPQPAENNLLDKEAVESLPDLTVVKEEPEKPIEIIPLVNESEKTQVSETNVELPVRKPQKLNQKLKKVKEKRQKKQLNTGEQNRYSPYRPYRCVHQGCFAAFTIQQNLILHYRAIHKSELPNFSQENEEVELNSEDHEEAAANQTVREFRCQMNNCSRIFPEVTSLIQHYTKLHELELEEIGNLISILDLGKFKCDQPHCASVFMDSWTYITHLELDHGFNRQQSSEEEEGIYKCDCEGCDKIYATRSNLLRHIFNKHNDEHKSHLIRPRKLVPTDQENISSNGSQEDTIEEESCPGIKCVSLGKKRNKTSLKPKIKRNNVKNLQSGDAKIEKSCGSLKCGKNSYVIKSKDEAYAMCTTRFAVQYPCMIKDCTSVVTSERNIIRHYGTHKLSRSFILQNTSLLIICKKRSASQRKETCERKLPEPEETSQEKKEVNALDGGLTENGNILSKSVCSQSKVEKDVMDELTELFSSKLINEDSSCSENKSVDSPSELNDDFVETNAGLPVQEASKSGTDITNQSDSVTAKKCVPEVVKSACSEKVTAPATCKQSSNKEQYKTFDLSTFKPMGFEVSFLKFLEESSVKRKRKTSNKDHSAAKKINTSRSSVPDKTTILSVDCHKELDACNRTADDQTVIKFANPSCLKSLENVNIVMGKTLKDCAELVLKQLQQMKPVVVLCKTEVDLHSVSEVESAKLVVIG